MKIQKLKELALQKRVLEAEILAQSESTSQLNAELTSTQQVLQNEQAVRDQALARAEQARAEANRAQEGYEQLKESQKAKREVLSQRYLELKQGNSNLKDTLCDELKQLEDFMSSGLEIFNAKVNKVVADTYEADSKVEEVTEEIEEHNLMMEEYKSEVQEVIAQKLEFNEQATSELSLINQELSSMNLRLTDVRKLAKLEVLAHKKAQRDLAAAKVEETHLNEAHWKVSSDVLEITQTRVPERLRELQTLLFSKPMLIQDEADLVTQLKSLKSQMKTLEQELADEALSFQSFQSSSLKRCQEAETLFQEHHQEKLALLSSKQAELEIIRMDIARIHQEEVDIVRVGKEKLSTLDSEVESKQMENSIATQELQNARMELESLRFQVQQVRERCKEVAIKKKNIE